MKTMIALVFAIIFTAAPAQASTDEGWPTVRNPSAEVCVHADFPEVGSGWRLHAAIRYWNEAQSAVHLSGSITPGCSLVTVHRYDGAMDRCGYASIEASDRGDGVFITSAVSVNLNDNCRGAVQPFTKRWSKYIVTHELGHALGLGHTFDEPQSIMCYCNDWPTYRGRPGPDDAARVTALYSEGDVAAAKGKDERMIASVEPRIETEAIIKVRPSDGVLRKGDPVKVCWGATTSVVPPDVPVKMAIEQKDLSAKDPQWSLLGSTTIQANNVRCLYGEAAEVGPMALRTRVIQSPYFARDTSRVIRLEVTS